MGEKDTAKEKLVEVTIELLCKGKKPSEITVAEITQSAGVGNGMVNYHFQSKDNLMKEAVKKVMACAKGALPECLKLSENASATERLSLILKKIADFFANNAEICKIAILDNLTNDTSKTHLLSDVELLNECVIELYKEKKVKKNMDIYIIIGYLNHLFLKAEVIKKEQGFDFYDKQQRDEAVDNLVHLLINFNNSNNMEDKDCD